MVAQCFNEAAAIQLRMPRGHVGSVLAIPSFNEAAAIQLRMQGMSPAMSGLVVMLQ